MAIGDIGLSSSMRSNLISLQSTAKFLGETQEKLSTGKRIKTAVDNPANFFAAQGHNTRANSLTGLKDNISEAIQTVKSADAGIKAVLTTIEAMRGVLTQARSAVNDTVNSATLIGNAAGTTGLGGQYNRLVEQLNNIAVDSNYKGTNFLTTTGTTLTVNFNENASTKIVMSGFNGGAAGLGISGGSTTALSGQTNAITVVAGASGILASGDIGTAAAIDAVEKTLNAAIATLQTQAGALAANLNTLTTRQTFISEMTNNLIVGATKLTEADTNEEGANLLSLQTKQSLGTTALSISSQAEQSILRLF